MVAILGAPVGAALGSQEGAALGPDVVGSALGAKVAPASVGPTVLGAALGISVGAMVGDTLGAILFSAILKARHHGVVAL